VEYFKDFTLNIRTKYNKNWAIFFLLKCFYLFFTIFIYLKITTTGKVNIFYFSIFFMAVFWLLFVHYPFGVLSQGTSIVSTNCHGGPKMILENGKYGKLIPVGNQELYVKTLNILLQKNEKDNNLIDYFLKFSVKFIANEYLNIMKGYNNVF
jgi:hypothetical protein